MIEVKDRYMKIARFGYGDIKLWAEPDGIYIQNIEPPQPIGISPRQTYNPLERRSCSLRLIMPEEMVEIFRKILKANNIFDWYDITLDFTSENGWKSKQVMERVLGDYIRITSSIAVG